MSKSKKNNILEQLGLGYMKIRVKNNEKISKELKKEGYSKAEIDNLLRDIDDN